MVLGCESGASEANRLSKRGVWVRVDPKVLTYPWNFVAGGAARKYVFVRASVDVTTVCVTCTGVEKVWVVR